MWPDKDNPIAVVFCKTFTFVIAAVGFDSAIQHFAKEMNARGVAGGRANYTNLLCSTAAH